MLNRDYFRLFRQTAQLMELHQENEFKTRTYTNTVTWFENLSRPYDELYPEPRQVDGLGKGMVEKIKEIKQTGTFAELTELLAKTPPGVVDLLEVKGLGPKKARILWLEHDIKDPEELLLAAENGTLSEMKGFGEKTQAGILQDLHFKRLSAGKILLPYAEQTAVLLKKYLSEKELEMLPTGELLRKNEIIEQLQFIIPTRNPGEANRKLDSLVFLEKNAKTSSPFAWRGKVEEVTVEFLLAKPEKAAAEAFLFSAGKEHLLYRNATSPDLLTLAQNGFSDENELYHKAGLPYLPPELRENEKAMGWVKSGKINDLVQLSDLKGILHNHSTWSDGKNTLEEMAVYCRDLGYEYLGITDHSQTASYANGLPPSRVEQQWQEIERLNQKLAPFRIFKGIESDILADGSLDYAPEMLAGFDFIVASIHANLNMDEKTATQRLLNAIENPYTTMLGHPTGRLLLRREGYPIDHKKVIDACAANSVIIEINANPYRLDLDWRFVEYAQNQGVMLSINPDAHTTEGYHDMQYGIYAARKGGLTKAMTFNAMGQTEVQTFFNKKRKNYGG
jgi:DNA polymerase (family X)